MHTHPPTASRDGQRRYVSVIGQSVADTALRETAEELGERLARAGLCVVCGGMGGIMSAVAQGVRRGGGVSIGILPELYRQHADDALTYSVCTGVGHARNLAVAASGDVVVAVGGSWGTLSEIALARCAGRTVILLKSWRLSPPDGLPAGLLKATSPTHAVHLVLKVLDGER